MKYLVACLLCAVAVAWAAPTALSAGCVEDGEPAIAIAPSTLLIGVEQGGAVTVHTNIPFGSVDASSLALNGVAAGDDVFADSQGDVVARFSEAAIEAMATAPGTMTLTLTGSDTDGEAFEASSTVTVKVAPQPGR